MNRDCQHRGCNTQVYRCEKHLVSEQLALARVEMRSQQNLSCALSWAVGVASVALNLSFVLVIYHLCVFYLR